MAACHSPHSVALLAAFVCALVLLDGSGAAAQEPALAVAAVATAVPEAASTAPAAVGASSSSSGPSAASAAVGASSGPSAATAGGASSRSSSSSDPFTRRRTVWLELPGLKTPFPLRLPRMLPLPDDGPTAIRLRVNDTCGLITVFHTLRQPAGAGPPPHLHYGETEWFLSAGTGATRVFTHQKATLFTPGRLPGFNVPPITAGSAVLTGTGNGVDRWGGQLVMSKPGSIHYFVRETAITDFFTVYEDGFADENIINYILYGGPYTPKDVLQYTGLFGIPTDMTGAFVGLPDETGEKKLYRQARGPIDVPDAHESALRLQALFDTVEATRCCKACLW